MGRRLTRRALVVLGVGALLVAAASTAQAGWLFVIAAGVFALVATSLLTRHRLDRCFPARDVAPSVRIGDDVRVVVTLENRGRSALPMLRVEDEFEAFEPQAIFSERIDPGGMAHAETVRRATRRGEFASGTVKLISGAPFGLVKTVRKVEVVSPVTVLPAWVELRSFPILEPSSSPAERLHERARTGAGQEYMGVREYRPGDPKRAVHWRSSARAGRLVVREFEEPGSTPVTVVMAGADVGSPPDSPFEVLVSAAASIALYAIATGHTVNLVRPGPEGAVEELASPGRADVLRWLAAAEPHDAPLDELVSPLLGRRPRRGTVVLLAPTWCRAGSSLPMATHVVQAAGSRPIGVIIRTSDWSISGPEGPIYEASVPEHARGDRVIARFVGRGEDLRACLESSRTGFDKPIQRGIPRSP